MPATPGVLLREKLSNESTACAQTSLCRPSIKEREPTGHGLCVCENDASAPVTGSQSLLCTAVPCSCCGCLQLIDDCEVVTVSSMSLLQSLGEAAKATSSRPSKPLKQLQRKLDSLKKKQANGTSLSVQDAYTAAFSAMQLGDYFWRGPHTDYIQVHLGCKVVNAKSCCKTSYALMPYTVQAQKYLTEALEFTQSLDWTCQQDAWIGKVRCG